MKCAEEYKLLLSVFGIINSLSKKSILVEDESMNIMLSIILLNDNLKCKKKRYFICRMNRQQNIMVGENTYTSNEGRPAFLFTWATIFDLEAIYRKNGKKEKLGKPYRICRKVNWGWELSVQPEWHLYVLHRKFNLIFSDMACCRITYDDCMDIARGMLIVILDWWGRFYASITF